MVIYNFSNVSVPYGGGSLEVQAQVLIRDFVTRIDDKIVLAILLIFSGYMLSYLILPRALLGLNELWVMFNYSSFHVILDFVHKVIKWLISLFETLALGGACFIFAIAYYQGTIGRKSLIWAGCLLGLLLLVFVVELIGFFRNRRYKKIIKKIKEIRDIRK